MNIEIGAKIKQLRISCGMTQEQLGNELSVQDMMANFGSRFESHSKYGGLMVIFKLSAVNRIL